MNDFAFMYRYVDDIDSIHIERFRVIKKTPKGQWVIPDYLPFFYSEADKKKHRKFVLDYGRKKLCYHTLEEAWNSYKIRKAWHEANLERKLELIKEFKSFADNNPPPATLVTRVIDPKELFYDF